MCKHQKMKPPKCEHMAAVRLTTLRENVGGVWSFSTVSMTGVVFYSIIMALDPSLSLC